MSFAEHQINPIDVNFHLQKDSADKIWSKKGQGGWKCTSSCQLGLSVTFLTLKIDGMKWFLIEQMVRNYVHTTLG